MIISFILRILLICFTAFGIPAIKRYLDKKCEEADTEKLIGLIYELVRAAEQLLYGKDEDGSLRKQYVMQQLAALGYEWDNRINAYVESAVYDLNREAHKEYSKKGVYSGYIRIDDDEDFDSYTYSASTEERIEDDDPDNDK